VCQRKRLIKQSKGGGKTSRREYTKRERTEKRQRDHKKENVDEQKKGGCPFIFRYRQKKKWPLSLTPARGGSFGGGSDLTGERDKL